MRSSNAGLRDHDGNCPFLENILFLHSLLSETSIVLALLHLSAKRSSLVCIAMNQFCGRI